MVWPISLKSIPKSLNPSPGWLGLDSPSAHLTRPTHSDDPPRPCCLKRVFPLCVGRTLILLALLLPSSDASSSPPCFSPPPPSTTSVLSPWLPLSSTINLDGGFLVMDKK
ncbi:hypothetical protein Salat_2956300 [Sesamum alatum]|uniref:Uncharacterized protein n=1 Tax=Sesamum alatum TaxID=300844 RepID=A0AAE2C8P5_9LAMI|nr:hypothetical protein Salat_2956300 [Sesamum alatum]